MFTKILIANRGEIACRIIKTCKKMGIQTVAIYSTVDENSLHVQRADEAFFIGDSNAKDSYLNGDSIINVAKQCQAEAVHPGYGFLSENYDFAQKCHDAGLVFIGPSLSSLKAMASKKIAKQLLESKNIPLIPGYHGNLQTNEKLHQEVLNIGLPVLIKPANGGGGKGMRAVHHLKDITSALEAARREALASFADDTLIIEKLLLNPRHIEVQIIADNFGNTVHLFERDCSLQRRHQKIIEEAPAAHLSEDLRQQITATACKVAQSIHYTNAGTVEFIVVDKQFYFMEMNTRLQVEHPVTEMITGIDLVSWQILVAANCPLPREQHAISKTGHAIECRIYAEDPENDFLPSIGRVRYLHEPQADGLRIDTGVSVHTDISQYYDPMIAKLIVWGASRTQALARLEHALHRYYIDGVTTNIPFLQTIIAGANFKNAAISTSFLDSNPVRVAPINTLPNTMLAISYLYDTLYKQEADPLFKASFAWQIQGASAWIWQFLVGEQCLKALILPTSSNRFQLTINEQNYSIAILKVPKPGFAIVVDGQKLEGHVVENAAELTVFSTLGTSRLRLYSHERKQSHETDSNTQFKAPMPATITAILKDPGSVVQKNEPLIILEAMKMEHTISAPRDGIIDEIFYSVGAQVLEGTQLLSLVEPTAH